MATTNPKFKSKWDVKRVRDLVRDQLGKRACWFQVQVALAIYEGKDVVACAATGAGKTLTFWMPLLMAIEDGHEDAMVIVVTPLNLLGKQNALALNDTNLPAIAVDRDNANERTFKVDTRKSNLSNSDNSVGH